MAYIDYYQVLGVDKKASQDRNDSALQIDHT